MKCSVHSNITFNINEVDPLETAKKISHMKYMKQIGLTRAIIRPGWL